MALVLKDRVRETSFTAGTGTITLSGAVAGFQSFAVIGDTNTTYYVIADSITGEWEVGIGTYTSSGTTLSRDTILESSDGGTAVDFAGNPKDVFCTYPAERSVYVDGSNIVPATASRLGFVNLAQGSALSVLGVTGNSAADVASIAAGTDNQVLRRSGTALAFGAVNLASTDAVTGTLPAGNGGTGITSLGTGVATALGQNVTGSGGIALATSPSFTTPTLGVATATSVNKVAITAPATSATLTIADGATLATSGANSLTLTTTGTTNVTLPTSGTLATTAGTVASFSAGTTGLTPNTATTGAVTLGGTLAVANGGTGVTTSTGSTSVVLSTSPSLTTPRVITAINDTNGNELFGVTATGSAVNEFTVANAATGNAPTLSATGGDTNIGMALAPKGTGGVIFPAGAVGTPAITTTGDLNTGIYFPAADTIGFVEGGVEAMRITSAGDVGIGTTSPAYKLDVSGPTNGILARFFSSVAARGLTITQYPVPVGATNEVGYDFNAPGSGASDGFLRFSTNSTERMRIDSSGNVGIGTTSVLSRLHVVTPATVGNMGLFVGDRTTLTAIKVANVNTGGSSGISLGEDNGTSNTPFYIQRLGSTSATPGEVRIVNGENAPIALYTNGTERARITSDGYFKASNTGSYLNATGPFHEFTQTTNNNGFQIRATSASLATDGFLFLRASRNTTNNTFYALDYYNDGSATYRFRVADSGNVTNTNNSYGSISDVKLKQDIVDAGSQWDDIKNLRIRKYRWKSEPDGFMQLGLVAQEAEDVSPGLIEEHPDRKQETRTREVEKTREVEVTPAVLDEDGNVVEPAVMETETYTEEEEYTATVDLGTTTKSVKYSVLYMKAVKALQEAMERIETLEAKVAALEGN
jgi:hypothetical protein